jgi:hypothetical protein
MQEKNDFFSRSVPRGSTSASQRTGDGVLQEFKQAKYHSAISAGVVTLQAIFPQGRKREVICPGWEN